MAPPRSPALSRFSAGQAAAAASRLGRSAKAWIASAPFCRAQAIVVVARSTSITTAASGVAVSGADPSGGTDSELWKVWICTARPMGEVRHSKQQPTPGP